MAVEQLAHWTCDRCGHVESAPVDTQPMKWQRVRGTSPPKADPLSSDTTQVADLCEGCSTELARFLDGRQVEADEPDTPAKKGK